MTTADVLDLEAVVPDGAAEEALAGLRSLSPGWANRVRTAVVGVATVGLAVATRHPAWLLLIPVWLGLRWTVGRTIGLRGMRTFALRPGSRIRAEWRERDLTVRRPSGTIVFQYAGMEVAGSTEHLTGVWVHNVLGRRKRSVLYLPTELVPPEAVARFRAAAPTDDDPFGAAEMPHVFRVPLGWPRTRVPLSTGRRVAIGFLLLFEVLMLAVLVLAQAWSALVVAIALVAAIAWVCWIAVFGQVRRRLTPGSLVGASFADRRVQLVLPDQRLDLPESRLRNVIPAGPDLVLFQFHPLSRAPVPVPRALVSDEEIDRLRVVAGRLPMRASQRSRGPDVG